MSREKLAERDLGTRRWECDGVNAPTLRAERQKQIPINKSGLGSYGDYVMETDWAIGEVLTALDKVGVANNTLVIATSDNGCSPAAGTTKLEAQGHFASAQFRGYKADIWDGGHHVAFFMRWPDRVKAGSPCAQLICLTDLMATCADHATGDHRDARRSRGYFPDARGSDAGENFQPSAAA